MTTSKLPLLYFSYLLQTTGAKLTPYRYGRCLVEALHVLLIGHPDLLRPDGSFDSVPSRIQIYGAVVNKLMLHGRLIRTVVVLRESWPVQDVRVACNKVKRFPYSGSMILLRIPLPPPPPPLSPSGMRELTSLRMWLY